ncbi:CarboxypepD_reg-like domain-containing protein [Reichenbachiella faecimaris]|uniref:CarboxypepD_reg-like domain-containing protein n=1 Tax=Reichenbachiella faecimaris TaxID=692418 RepID=A0A1W2GDL9_REIFA|nr:carboxypeptidase-like regulatory domain-containing protein [Reichenbachiella faecimaris]SMD34760.1 CarboxypepD_reg-like domain-containing protein [Reichenbachiella faecimaris]
MHKLTPFLLAIVLFWSPANAQFSEALFSGQLLDQQTLKPIPFVHIVGVKTQVISNSNGVFSIEIQKGDSLTFSHINFERSSIQISEISDQVIPMYLKKKENLMQEVIIRDYLPEEELKQEMMAYKVPYTVEEINAVNNVEYSTLLYKKGYIPEMNSLDNFKNYMKEPQGVTLFSSDPSKGIIKSIKRPSQQNKSYYSSSLRLNKTKIDTTMIDQFFIQKK